MKVYDRTMGMMLGRRETGRDIRHAIMEQVRDCGVTVWWIIVSYGEV